MKKLEKECQSWKSRFDGCNKNLIDMVADVRNLLFSVIDALIHKYTFKNLINQKKNLFTRSYFSTVLNFYFFTESNQGKRV